MSIVLRLRNPSVKGLAQNKLSSVLAVTIYTPTSRVESLFPHTLTKPFKSGLILMARTLYGGIFLSHQWSLFLFLHGPDYRVLASILAMGFQGTGWQLDPAKETLTL